MVRLLDTPLHDLFADRPLLALTVRAIQLDTGRPWLDAAERLHDAAEEEAKRSSDATVSSVLQLAGCDPEFVAEAVTLLERRDATVRRAYKRASKTPKLETDERGRVLLDSDPGRAMHDPAKREARFQRARKAATQLGDRQYDMPGNQGRKVFEQDDREWLEAGRDLVATLEQVVRQRDGDHEAEQAAHQTAYLLDSAIAQAGKNRAELRLLDKQLADLDGTADSVSLEAARAQVRSRADKSTGDAVKLLDQMGAINKKKSRKKRRNATAKLLEQATAHGAPPAPTPDGVHPGSRLLDQRVRERMRELNAPETDYVKVLDGILEEEA